MACALPSASSVLATAAVVELVEVVVVVFGQSAREDEETAAAGTATADGEEAEAFLDLGRAGAEGQSRLGRAHIHLVQMHLAAVEACRMVHPEEVQKVLQIEGRSTARKM